MKINLPIFKDEDTKDAVTYQSWRLDLTVYRHVLSAGIVLSCHMPSGPYKVIREN